MGYLVLGLEFPHLHGKISYIFCYAMLSILFICVLLSLRFLDLNVFTPLDSLSSYECGFDPISVSHTSFCMKFFLIAILYLVFDVEVGFIVPCLYSSHLIWSFIFILLLGLLFEYAYGGLDWVS